MLTWLMTNSFARDVHSIRFNSIVIPYDITNDFEHLPKVNLLPGAWSYNTKLHAWSEAT